MTAPTPPHKPIAAGAAVAPHASAGAGAPIDSRALFGGATEVQIVHAGVVYRLRQTALGKLILTK